jgi:short-subunit dehydrogenase
VPTIAVFGAGKALGLSTAQVFGSAGFAVELVGRRRATVEPLVATLRSQGVDVNASLADLTSTKETVDTLGGIIERRRATPDVILYSPGDVSRLPVDARTLTAAELSTWLPLNLFSPLDLVHAALPGMLRRGSGTVVVAQGTGVRVPMPALASSTVAQAALLNYLVALDAQVRPEGVQVASLQIGQLIERSAAADLFEAGHFSDVETEPLPTISPDDLARRILAIAQEGARVENRT